MPQRSCVVPCSFPQPRDGGLNPRSPVDLSMTRLLSLIGLGLTQYALECAEGVGVCVVCLCECVCVSAPPVSLRAMGCGDPASPLGRDSTQQA